MPSPAWPPPDLSLPHSELPHSTPLLVHTDTGLLPSYPTPGSVTAKRTPSGLLASCKPGCSLWQLPSLNDAPLRTSSWLPSMTACQVMMLPYGRHPGCSLWQPCSSYGAPLRTPPWLPPSDSPVQCGAPPNPGTLYLVHHLAALTHVAVHGRHLQTALLAT